MSLLAHAVIRQTPLSELLQTEIARNGPMNVVRYMDLCLSHPQYGYYMTRDPLGTRGDFTTAPEISQMFGEVIGAYVAQQWHTMGAPRDFHLVECGPGRGTLMKDMLRVMQRVPNFRAQVHLVETSPVLREIQKAALQNAEIAWHETLDTVPQGAFALIANEFLDALPIEQFIFVQGQWHERCIGLQNGALVFVLGDVVPLNIQAKEGDVFERSPAREYVMRQLCARLKRDRGFALLIDYGAVRAGIGDTLQAVRSHKYVDVFEAPGECDLTSHVDFAALEQITLAQGCNCMIATQGEFLMSLGIEARAAILQQKNPGANINAALQRLIGAEQMGKLFKVMVVSS